MKALVRSDLHSGCTHASQACNVGIRLWLAQLLIAGADSILGADTQEARSTLRGIGLVKLMGRSSGFIAMQASMASGEGIQSRRSLLHRGLPGICSSAPVWLVIDGPARQAAGHCLVQVLQLGTVDLGRAKSEPSTFDTQASLPYKNLFTRTRQFISRSPQASGAFVLFHRRPSRCRSCWHM